MTSEECFGDLLIVIVVIVRADECRAAERGCGCRHSDDNGDTVAVYKRDLCYLGLCLLGNTLATGRFVDTV